MSEKDRKIYDSKKKEQQGTASQLDTLKWALIFSLLVGGIIANSYFGTVAWAIRTAIGIVVLLLIFAMVLQTNAGQLLLSFAKGAKTEMRKVVWPTQQETIQTTLVVVAMVVCFSLILWGMDTVLFWLIGLLAGQRS